MHSDLMTQAGRALQGRPWQEYPRPTLRRDSYFNLNGEWEFSAGSEAYDRTIRVPFPPESLLSGIHETYPDGTALCYRRRFRLPEGFVRGCVLLHFGAADQVAEVALNGVRLGAHTGGYAPFSFEVTDALREENVLTVRVTDELDNQILPYGKQKHERGGMWYTPVSGLWQTVWMESVPEEYIRAVRPEISGNRVTLHIEGAQRGTVRVKTPQSVLTQAFSGGQAVLELPAPRLWSPEDPYLYETEIETVQDRVQTYFALRALDVREVDGFPRLCLNGRPYFFHGVLDQGYWSDGLFTPASPACFDEDILAMKRLGFNTLRKHIKVEPELFYYACDRLGMVVFQDMVNNGAYSFFTDTALPTLGIRRRNDRRMHRDPATRRCCKSTPASATGRSSTRAGGSLTVRRSSSACARWTIPALSTRPPAGSAAGSPTWRACTSISSPCACRKAKNRSCCRNSAAIPTSPRATCSTRKKPMATAFSRSSPPLWTHWSGSIWTRSSLRGKRACAPRSTPSFPTWRTRRTAL